MRSILLHVDDDTGLESRMQAAFDLARTFGGHVTCLHSIPFEDYLRSDPLAAAYLPVEAILEAGSTVVVTPDSLRMDGTGRRMTVMDDDPSEAK